MPGAPSGGRRTSFIRPQHRMVFGLMVMAAASLVLSISFTGKQVAKGRPVPAGGVPLERVVLLPPDPGTVLVGPIATDAALDQAVLALDTAIGSCAAAHQAEFGGTDGKLQVELILDVGGLHSAAVLGAVLPGPGAVSCLAASVHQLPWPTVAGDPLELRVPFYVVAPLDSQLGPDGAPPKTEVGPPSE